MVFTRSQTNKRYYEKNKEKIKKANKKYQEEYRQSEKGKKYQKDYREKNTIIKFSKYTIMETLNNKLLALLKELSECIVGEWVVVGGAMLGIHRDCKLIEGDNDIDIYLLQGSYIKKLPKHIGSQSYYMNDKIYYKDEEVWKPKNKWLEYISFVRMKPELKGLNRAELTAIACKTYQQEYIEPEFSDVQIDVHYLREDGTVPYWDKYNLKPIELNNIEVIEYTDEYTTINLPVPGSLDDVCLRHYGPNWRIPLSKAEAPSY